MLDSSTAPIVEDDDTPLGSRWNLTKKNKNYGNEECNNKPEQGQRIVRASLFLEWKSCATHHLHPAFSHSCLVLCFFVLSVV